MLIVVAAVLAVLVFFVRPMLLPPQGSPPPASLLPAFIFLDIWDAIAFGAGIAFLIYLALNYSKWPKSIRGPLAALFVTALFFSIPNWFHDASHAAGAAPPNWQWLAMIEYEFHFPWFIFSAVLVLAAIKIARTQSTG